MKEAEEYYEENAPLYDSWFCDWDRPEVGKALVLQTFSIIIRDTIKETVLMSDDEIIRQLMPKSIHPEDQIEWIEKFQQSEEWIKARNPWRKLRDKLPDRHILDESKEIMVKLYIGHYAVCIFDFSDNIFRLSVRPDIFYADKNLEWKYIE